MATQSFPSSTSTQPGRFDFLDNLKWFLTMLVIAHHSAIAFGASGSWYYVIPAPDGSFAPRILSLYTGIQQAFFMSLFFAISAYFLVPSYDRKGARKFLLDRAKRLGIPLVVYFFFLGPTLVYMSGRFYGRINDSWPQFMSKTALDYLDGGRIGPLWFVETLLIFSVVYVGIRLLRPPPEPPRTPRPLPSPIKITGFILLLAALTFGVRIIFPFGAAIAGLQLGEFPLYIALFVLGVYAYRHYWLDQLDPKATRPFICAAVVAIAVIAVAIISGSMSTSATSRGAAGLFYALFQAVVCVGLCFFFLRLFRARFNHSSRFSKNLTGAAYTAYIVHPFFVITVTALIAELPGGPLIHFALLAPLAITTTFAVSHVLRKLPGLRAIL